MRSPLRRLHPPLHPRRLVTFALLACAALSCKETFTPLTPIANIRLEPTSAVITIGRTEQLEVTLTDAAGAPITGRTVRFVSSNPAVATVSETGLVTAVAFGRSVITASIEGKSATSTIDVQGAIGSIVLTPPSTVIIVGSTQQLTVSVQDASGMPLPGRPVFFQTSNPAVATVTTTGVVAGISVGQATITASAEGKSATCQVTVSPIPVNSVQLTPSSPQLLRVGTSLQLTATPRAASGQALPDRPVIFSSANPAIASVSSSGVVTALDVGTTTISAESEGKIASVALTVTLQPVATVSVIPASTSIAVNTPTQFTVALADSAGRPLSSAGRTIVWSSTNNPVATVDGLGVVTGKAPGSAQIQATVEGKTGSASVNVTP